MEGEGPRIVTPPRPDHIVVAKLPSCPQRKVARVIHTSSVLLNPITLVELWSQFEIPLEYKLRVATESNPAHTPPPGYMVVYDQQLPRGIKFPLHNLVKDILNFWKLALGQITPNGYRLIMGFLIMCQCAGVIPSVNLLRYFYIIKHNRSRPLSTSRTSISIHFWRTRFFFDKIDLVGVIGVNHPWNFYTRLNTNPLEEITKNTSDVRALDALNFYFILKDHDSDFLKSTGVRTDLHNPFFNIEINFLPLCKLLLLFSRALLNKTIGQDGSRLTSVTLIPELVQQVQGKTEQPPIAEQIVAAQVTGQTSGQSSGTSLIPRKSRVVQAQLNLLDKDKEHLPSDPAVSSFVATSQPAVSLGKNK